MVRLVITDFAIKEKAYEHYKVTEYDAFKEIFVYSNFKKEVTYVPESVKSEKFYSINELSKSKLEDEEFLIYVNEEEFILLFNHKTIFYTYMDENFFLEDLSKSIVVMKHMNQMISNIPDSKIVMVVESSKRSLIKTVLENNISIPIEQRSLEEMIQNEPTMDTNNSFMKKNLTFIASLALILWIGFYGFSMLSHQIFYKTSLQKINKDLKLHKRLISRANVTIKTKQKEYEELKACMTNKEVL